MDALIASVKYVNANIIDCMEDMNDFYLSYLNFPDGIKPNFFRRNAVKFFKN